jgi:hypothetical protein
MRRTFLVPETLELVINGSCCRRHEGGAWRWRVWRHTEHVAINASF